MKASIATNRAPRAIGPYAQAVKCGGFVFVSGQLPIDPETGDFVAGGVGDLTRRALLNVQSILEEAGSALDRVVKTTVFLADMNDFAEMNQAYAEFFSGDACPARACVEVSRLPRGGRVEIEAIAEA